MNYYTNAHSILLVFLAKEKHLVCNSETEQKSCDIIFNFIHYLHHTHQVNRYQLVFYPDETPRHCMRYQNGRTVVN